MLRQLVYYPYHIGQIICLVRMMKWGRMADAVCRQGGSSAEFNAGMGMELPLHVRFIIRTVLK